MRLGGHESGGGRRNDNPMTRGGGGDEDGRRATMAQGRLRLFAADSSRQITVRQR